jgi:hypothetical protein
VVREPIYQNEAVEVRLRHVEDGGEPVPRGFQHPVTVAPVRVAHILASLSYEDRDGKQHPVIRNAHVYPLAEGIGEALGRATPDDEVIAYARSRDRRLGIFSVDRITAFGVHMESSQLYIEFYVLEHRLEELAKEGRSYNTPLELPEKRGSFRLLPGKAQAAAGPRTLAVDWRNAHFRRPLGLRRGGGLRRRTVLMEAEELEEEQPLETPPARAAQPSTTDVEPSMTDAQLRALDQLDAVRRAGLVSEAEFQRRRRLVLEGRLEEAGYGTDPQ